MPGMWKMAVHEENMMNVSDLPTVQRFYKYLNRFGSQNVDIPKTEQTLGDGLVRKSRKW